MRNKFALITGALALTAIALVATTLSGEKAAAWNAKATIIEACSCPMFCQCYFNAEPASHMMPAAKAEHPEHPEHPEKAGHGGAEHFCRFNMGIKIDEGRHGKTDLAGAKFWVAGDLGAEFDDGKLDWSVLTFDEATTPEQREGIVAFITTVFPVEWESFSTGVGKIDWKAGSGAAHATLDGGKTAEIKLAATENAANKSKPVVIQNLQYWNAKKNHGFVMMPNEVEAWRVGDKAFEFKGTNGFMVTVEADSSWAAETIQ